MTISASEFAVDGAARCAHTGYADNRLQRAARRHDFGSTRIPTIAVSHMCALAGNLRRRCRRILESPP